MVHIRELFYVVCLITALSPLRGQEVAPAKHPRNERSEQQARKVIEAYFPLFSKRDVKGLLGVVNFPHVRVTDSRTVIIPSAKEWTGDPTPLEEHWSRSALDSLTFVQSDEDKVHALVDCP